MTPSHAELLALVDQLRDQITLLERRVAELSETKPRPTCDELYPKRFDEV